MTDKSPASTSTRERIIDAALQAFAGSGFIGATTKEIARKAKVNEVTVFRLFRSKKALFSAVVAERSPLITIKDAVETGKDTPVDQLLENNLKIVLRTLRQNKALYFVMVGDAWRQPRTRGLAYDVAIKRGIGFVAGFMSKLMDAGKLRRMDPETVARAWMGAVQFYFLTTDVLGEGTPTPTEDDRMIKGLVSAFLDGMRANHGGGHV